MSCKNRNVITVTPDTSAVINRRNQYRATRIYVKKSSEISFNNRKFQSYFDILIYDKLIIIRFFKHRNFYDIDTF